MVASLSMGALAGMSLGTELSALRKRAVLQQFPAALVYGDSCVAKRYCISGSIGDTFVQCRSATPESPPTIRTPPPRWRRSRPLVASASIVRRLPADAGTGRN